MARVGQSGHLTEGFAVGGIIGTPAVGSVAVARRCSRPPRFRRRSPNRSTRAIRAQWLDTSLAEDPGRLLSLSAIDAGTGAVLWRSPLSRQSYGTPTYADGVVLVPSTFSAEAARVPRRYRAAARRHAGGGSPSSSPTVVGDTIYLGGGTRTSDLEFKAFGASAAEALLGASPLSPASGLFAYRIAAPSLVGSLVDR